MYGKSHLKTEFAIDEYIIQADAVRYIYFSDLDNLKINKPITGLICLNPDKDLKEKFNETVNKLYDYIQLKEKENDSFISLDILLEKYKEYTNNDENISIEKKIHILTKIVKECNFSDIDTLSILTQLSELVFGKKIDISYLKNNKIDYPTYIIIVAIKNNNRYIYYYLDLYNENLEVYNITSSELQRKLNMSIYETNERYLPKGLKK